MMRMNIELVEALCGFQKVIRTLDDRDLVISSPPNTVIQNQELKCILNEGMPVHKDPFTHGRLIIQFLINFPKTISPDVIPLLKQCLPSVEEIIVPDDAEECVLTEFDPEHDRRDQREAYEEDEGGPSRVQCATH